MPVFHLASSDRVGRRAAPAWQVRSRPAGMPVVRTVGAARKVPVPTAGIGADPLAAVAAGRTGPDRAGRASAARPPLESPRAMVAAAPARPMGRSASRTAMPSRVAVEEDQAGRLRWAPRLPALAVNRFSERTYQPFAGPCRRLARRFDPPSPAGARPPPRGPPF